MAGGPERGAHRAGQRADRLHRPVHPAELRGGPDGAERLSGAIRVGFSCHGARGTARPCGPYRLAGDPGRHQPHCVTAHAGPQWVSTANFGSGSIAVYRIEADGRLSEAVDSAQHTGKGPHATRQTGPHAHSTYYSADNKTLYAVDLGIDEVRVYGFDAGTGKLTPREPLRTPPGAGPRHLALGKKRIYVLNEIGSTVSVFEKSKLLETVNALPAGFTGDSSSAEILIDKAEKYLYASNRGADTIAVFRIGAKLEKIADTKVGRIPRGFTISPDGRFLIAGSQSDNTIQVFRIDAKTGLLSPAGAPLSAPGPICFRFAR